MSAALPAVLLASGGLLFTGYFAWSRFVQRHLGPDDARATPAERFADGNDYVPTPRFYLLSQHFSAIAAAGPIAGPILACQSYGWLPCLVWIVLGVVFIGAVHDYSALFASVRHDARSVAEILRQHVGPRAALLLLSFIWVSLVYVILAFTDITAANFVGKSEDLPNGTTFDAGGAVAAASVSYLLLAIVLGLVQRFVKAPLVVTTLVFVPATLGVVWLGTKVSTWLVYPAATWGVAILAYCAVASLLPMWLLLQPRGYLGGFVLYLALGVGVLGVLFGGHEIAQPAVTSAPWFGADGAPLFPFLFVTIACGACSGFHGLVCSGTTSKQVMRESHCRPIGYGAMLLEAFTAVIALSTVMILGKTTDAPGRVYGDGIGTYLSQVLGAVGIGGDEAERLRFARTFGAMAFSTFVFDTLDVSVRLGRYILQELTKKRGWTSGIVATLATAAVPGVLLWIAGPGSYATFWKLFGSSNQLLAALTLLAVAAWLKKSGKPAALVLIPAVFVGVITVTALVLQARAGFVAGTTGGVANAIVAIALLALAGRVAADALRR